MKTTIIKTLNGNLIDVAAIIGTPTSRYRKVYDCDKEKYVKLGSMRPSRLLHQILKIDKYLKPFSPFERSLKKIYGDDFFANMNPYKIITIKPIDIIGQYTNIMSKCMTRMPANFYDGYIGFKSPWPQPMRKCMTPLYSEVILLDEDSEGLAEREKRLSALN